MRLWCAIIVILLVTPVALAQISGPRPQRGEWLCWATNVQEECGTYGWHKQKSVALKAAMNLCDKVCNPGCVKDYCERIK
jgi:hypothetical protein